MLDKLFEVASYSEMQSAFRLGEILIAATLAFFLATRIAILVASIAKVKAKKEWVVEPARLDHSFFAQLRSDSEQKSTSQNLFGDEIKRMLEQRANAAKSR